MEVRKVLRKATAIAASVSFIGATMLSAVAQDLKDYPSPFVKDGQFDAFIVVGADAQPSDVVGAVDVGASLQFSLKKATTVGTGASEATISEGVKVQKSGDRFNYGDSIASVEASSSLSSGDLPAILGDGKYVESEGANKNSVTYTQRLLFDDNATAKLEYAQDDDLAPKAGDYVFIDRSAQLYNYTLEFDQNVDYDNSSSAAAEKDLKTSTLQIQGQTYTITGVDTTSSKGGSIDKLTLLSGEAVLWLTQNNPITKTINGVEHKVEVLDVTENADACQVKVDDTTAIIDVDETKTVNGVQIGVTDVRAIHAQLQDVDVCQISIGASQVEIRNGKKLKVDDKELDGTKGLIASDASGELTKLSVTYKPTDQSDDIYLASGKEFIDPIFHSWKVAYGGLTANYETDTVKRSGSKKAKFVFMNNDGKQIDVPIFLNDSSVDVKFGDGKKNNEQFLAADGSGGHGVTGLDTVCAPVSGDVTDCEGLKILASTTGGEAHVFELTKVDFTGTSEKNTTDLKDLTYGRTFENKQFTAGTPSAIDLGSFGSISLTITPAAVTVTDSVKGKIESKAKGSVRLNQTLDSKAHGNATVSLDESNRNGADDIADELTPSSQVNIDLRPDTTNEEIDIFSSVVSSLPTRTANHLDTEKDSDFDVSVTPVGTKVTDNNNNDDSVVVEMPYSEVYGNVFLAPIVASVSTAAGGLQSFTLSKLNVGAAKLDTEISDVAANNLIVVGGPCANRVAATVLGKTFPACGADSGITANTGIIKEVAQSTGKVALVVAGWESADTRRATRVLANFDQYALSGSMVTVTGTSMTDIQVKKSA